MLDDDEENSNGDPSSKITKAPNFSMENPRKSMWMQTSWKPYVCRIKMLQMEWKTKIEKKEITMLTSWSLNHENELERGLGPLVLVTVLQDLIYHYKKKHIWWHEKMSPKAHFLSPIIIGDTGWGVIISMTLKVNGNKVCALVTKWCQWWQKYGVTEKGLSVT